MTTEETMELLFGPEEHATPEQSYWPPLSATLAAHDYARRNTNPVERTVAGRLETAFLAGAQWALTHNPADGPASTNKHEVTANRKAVCAATRDEWICTQEEGHNGPHVAAMYGLWGEVCDVREEQE